ncbi:Reverse transcriptase domain [Arabidopsis thaliana x Arabidopsis arenosa]|uniref:Reverse transcriptase domain n=1 Tax=Arabidopsis thaliana x Arabidopsis arenosa TaxID=1240361 RepID=A0A8T2BL39_9BRAS|nr:Reverse transcriptase domain [Arabidopsis thaliana x Arabidopsis arenosa]
MDVLSKKLDKGVIEQRFGLHPQCVVPMITHLSFADDILIFFDGTEVSLTGILHILDEFKLESGLGINKNKTALFLDGGQFQEIQRMAASLGVSHGALPVRYLGVPLSSCKMKRQDFQPLIDKILSRFNAWTVKHLSFAGRLQLIQSVIYSTITFWASIFILPNKCLEEIESMCSAFLWKGSPNSARGAKVSWDSVCTPKETGGLGLKRLIHWNKVLGLKLIWMIFAAGGSLWVSWIRRNLIGRRSFWDMENISSGSWIWKSLCKLRPLARPFIVCEIGSGITCNFWSDNWTSLGPLLELTGTRGPRVTGLPLTTVVADALREGQWQFSNSRSRSPIIQLLRDCLPPSSIVDLQVDARDDVYLWKIGDRQATNVFSTANTWAHLHPPGISVDWHDSVWFKGRIPKHAFIAWLISRNRLLTRDRLIRWRFNVPPTCLLCNQLDESRQHLFFDCSYAAEVWSYFCDKAHVSPPHLFADGVRWIKNPCRDKNTALILRLAFHASMYYIWKERNSRLHNSSSKPASVLILEIKSILRCHLDPLTRAQQIIPPAPSLLVTWFGIFQ